MRNLFIGRLKPWPPEPRLPKNISRFTIFSCFPSRCQLIEICWHYAPANTMHLLCFSYALYAQVRSNFGACSRRACWSSRKLNCSQTWFSQGTPGYPSSKLKNSTEMELNEFDRVGLSFGHWHADPSTAESCMNSHRCRGFWQSQLILPRIWSTTLPSSLRQRDCWFEKFTFARLAQLYGLRSVASRVSCCNTANSFSLQGPCWSD